VVNLALMIGHLGIHVTKQPTAKRIRSLPPASRLDSLSSLAGSRTFLDKRRTGGLL